MILLHKQSIQETWYNILNVKEDASYEDIRGNYRACLLNSHPDKLQITTQEEPGDDRFIQVQKAWEILGNSTTRAIYDAELRELRTDETIVADDIFLEDMMVEEGDGGVLELYYQCRCGDYYSVSSTELEEEACYQLSRDEKGEVFVVALDRVPGTIVLPCGSCSLKVRLMIHVDDPSLVST